jgi:hypothetical protein
MGRSFTEMNTNKTRSPWQMDDGSLHIYRSFTEMNSPTYEKGTTLLS